MINRLWFLLTLIIKGLLSLKMKHSPSSVSRVVGYGFTSGQLDESYVPSHHSDESQRNAGRHGVNLVVVNGKQKFLTLQFLQSVFESY